VRTAPLFPSDWRGTVRTRCGIAINLMTAWGHTPPLVGCFTMVGSSPERRNCGPSGNGQQRASFGRGEARGQLTRRPDYLADTQLFHFGFRVPPESPPSRFLLLTHFALPFRFLPPQRILIVARPSDPIQRQRVFAECLQLIRSEVSLQPICLVRDDPDISLYIAAPRVLTVEGWENRRCVGLCRF
jgi:hypothetical protein